MKVDHSLRVVLAQLNFTVGDIVGNATKIIQYAIQAREALNADLIVFPELALSGYSPEDWLLRDDFNREVQKGLSHIQHNIQGIDIILGYPEKLADHCYNKAVYLQNGKIIADYKKQRLPNYAVFDEARYFKPGNQGCLVSIKNIPIAILICEDLWEPEPIQQIAKQGAQCVIAINASPFERHKATLRESVLKKRCCENNIPIFYVNLIGAQDELVFDGGSLFMDAKGIVCYQADFFKEELLCIDLNAKNSAPFLSLSLPSSTQSIPKKQLQEEALVYEALVLGTRDYIQKNNFKRVLLGLSGGIDSALATVIAVDAIGKENVETIMMPSRYTTPISIAGAKEISELLGVAHKVVSIEPLFTATLETLAPLFTGLPPDITEENIQARARGLLLMALSNKKKALLLSASNKSEMAVGYTTLYGDMVGGFCVLKDVYKTMVYALVHYRNGLSMVIPDNIIARPPSAELAPNQKDGDTLPPYPILDKILEHYLEKKDSIEKIVAAGFDETVVHQIIAMVHRSEYKRRQAPPGPRITSCAFGCDRRYPITQLCLL